MTTTTSAEPVRTTPDYPRGGRLIGRVSARTAGAAALVAGALSVISGVLQLLFPQDEDPAIDPRTRVILAMFTVSLWLLAVLFLGLARYARSTWGAAVAGSGTVLLTLGTITSAINGIDLAFFPPVAMLANALWLVGVIALTVSLVRARRIPVVLAVALPIIQVSLVFLSQLGGGVIAGAVLLILGGLLVAGRIDRAAR